MLPSGPLNNPPMAQDPEEKKPFTVTDRRRVSLEDDASEVPAAETPAPSPAAAGEVASPFGVRGPLPKVEFSAFIASLAAQAAALLGDEERPAEGEAAAREIIAILEMLEEKTEGRRTDPENQILEAILFELRMVFVHRDGVVRP